MLPAGRATPGQKLVLGVRPEHIRLQPNGRWQAPVQLVEPMGNHQVVWMQLQGQTLSALVHDGRPIEMGEVLAFDIDDSRLNVFDASSELRLG